MYCWSRDLEMRHRRPLLGDCGQTLHPLIPPAAPNHVSQSHFGDTAQEKIKHEIAESDLL